MSYSLLLLLCLSHKVLRAADVSCLPPGVRGLSGGRGDLSSVDLMQTLPDVVPDVLEFVEALNQSEAE